MDKIKVYETIKIDDSRRDPDLTKIFVFKEGVDSEGNIVDFTMGTSITSERSGTQYIVDKYVADQIDKLKILEGELVVKDGETLDVPKKTPEEIEREQLLARLAELDGA